MKKKSRSMFALWQIIMLLGGIVTFFVTEDKREGLAVLIAFAMALIFSPTIKLVQKTNLLVSSEQYYILSFFYAALTVFMSVSIMPRLADVTLWIRLLISMLSSSVIIGSCILYEKIMGVSVLPEGIADK